MGKGEGGLGVLKAGREGGTRKKREKLWGLVQLSQGFIHSAFSHFIFTV